jgi:phage-related protein
MADQNADRDLFNFEKVEGGINFSNQSPSSRSESEKDLLKEVRKRVEARLAGQLHHAVRLNLQKELQPKQVRPWSMEVKVARATKSTIVTRHNNRASIRSLFGSVTNFG